MLPDRRTLTGMIFGAFGAATVMAIGPGAVMEVFADEPGGIDTGALVRFEAGGMRVTHQDWVSTSVTASATVTKIGYGRTTAVTISTTATGTYSSDALGSPHVLYPGITVERTAEAPSPAGWSLVPLTRGGSILYLRTDGGTHILTDGTTTCMMSARYAIC